MITAMTMEMAIRPQVELASRSIKQPSADISRPTMTSEDKRVEEWERVARKLTAMLTVEDDWDGMGAKAPAWGAVQGAIALAACLADTPDFPAPIRVVPTPSGTIGFEWQEPSVYTEAEILESGRSEWMRIKDGESPEHWEFNGVPDTYFAARLSPTVDTSAWMAPRQSMPFEATQFTSSAL